MRIIFLPLVFSLFLITKVKAQFPKTINVVTTPVPFLRVSPDARAGGMGDVGIATSGDANAIFWNMSKTVFAEANSGISLNYNPWLRDIAPNIYMGVISGYKKIDDGQAIAASVRYFSLGDVQFTDFNGNLLQTYKPREFSIDLGYAKKLSEKMGFGITARYINSALANGGDGQDVYKTGSSVAADISLFYQGLNKNGQGFCWGVSASNLGAKIGYTDNADAKDFIPANLGAGVAYTNVIDADNKISFALDANKLLVPELEYTGDANQDLINMNKYRQYSVAESWLAKNHSYNASAGAEYGFKNMFFLRAGYFYEGKNQGNRKYVTTGFGIKYSSLTLNFSYLIPSGDATTRNPLSNTLRFGLQLTNNKK
ncbi:MAG: type IX secretion system outer membrane channel protein PorV [Ferruginibacter sp.]